MALENNAQKTKRLALEALSLVVQATVNEQVAPENRYTYIDEKLGEWLVKKEYAVMNKQLKNEKGEFAVRATEAGINFEKENVKMSTETVTETAKPKFEIETGIEMPKTKRGGNGGVGNKVYPFDELEVNQSFFVAGKDVKKFGGTVATANARYTETVKNGDGSVQTRITKKGKNPGKEVAVTKQVREFKVRADKKDGVEGVRVFRVL